MGFQAFAHPEELERLLAPYAKGTKIGAQEHSGGGAQGNTSGSQLELPEGHTKGVKGEGETATLTKIEAQLPICSVCDWIKARFLNLSAIDILGLLIHCCGDCIVGY